MNIFHDHAHPESSHCLRLDLKLTTTSPVLAVCRWDAIIKVTATCICGSDLHFYNGFMPGMLPGTASDHSACPLLLSGSASCRRH